MCPRSPPPRSQPSLERSSTGGEAANFGEPVNDRAVRDGVFASEVADNPGTFRRSPWDNDDTNGVGVVTIRGFGKENGRVIAIATAIHCAAAGDALQRPLKRRLADHFDGVPLVGVEENDGDLTLEVAGRPVRDGAGRRPSRLTPSEQPANRS